MTRLLGTILIILAGFVAYMYFFGKGEDKEKAHTIVSETRDLGKSVGDFIKRQKDNYDNGSFDSLFVKIRNSVDKIKGKTEKKSDQEQQDLRELEKQLKQIDPQKLSEKNREELKKLLQDLEKELN